MNREEILQRFEQLVDSALAVEEPPTGIDPAILSALGEPPEEGTCDSYALWAAITGLTQEVKLQGRAFQELNHTLQAQTNNLLEEIHATYAARESALRRDAELRCRKEALSAMIDLRDRLGRGRESVRAGERESRQAAGASWWKRVFAPPAQAVPQVDHRGQGLFAAAQFSVAPQSALASRVGGVNFL